MFDKGLLQGITQKAININRVSKKIIVFPEADEKILEACSAIIKRGIAHPIVLGNEVKIDSMLNRLKIKNFTSENIYDYLAPAHKNDIDDFSKLYLEIRKQDKKIITIQQANEKMRLPHYFAAMMVSKGLADGMISGINSETKPYLPTFEIIKTKEGISRASGLFIMMDQSEKHVYYFADCALNIDPTAEQLAEIALTTADTVINFGQKPMIAMLSFSTRDSAKHEMVDKVKKATALARGKDKDLIIDGEIQLDAAIIPEVAQKKCPDSPLLGEANILIFPDLNSGNIGYKLVQRMANYKAIGPIIQGLNKPVNDLSRGASIQDIVDLAAITIIQGL
jgi:phosphate acetyltransferase